MSGKLSRTVLRRGKGSNPFSLVDYQSHIENLGWEADSPKGWQENNSLSGAEGQSLRLEAIQVNLTGSDAEQFDLYYRTHVQNVGDLGWAKNGQMAGSQGYGYRLEGIWLVLVRAGETPPAITNSKLAFYDKDRASKANIYDVTFRTAKKAGSTTDYHLRH